MAVVSPATRGQRWFTISLLALFLLILWYYQ
jgi:hypothetical protein